MASLTVRNSDQNSSSSVADLDHNVIAELSLGLTSFPEFSDFTNSISDANKKGKIYGKDISTILPIATLLRIACVRVG